MLVAPYAVPAQAAPILAFDTSTETLALAVNGPAGAYSLTTAGGALASAHLLPQALRLLALAGLQLQDLHAIAFGIGPGAFTGLRTACAVAQGLGLGLGLPLLPLDSLLVVAEDARLQLWACGDAAPAGPCDVAVAMDARMHEVYAGRYCWQPADAAAGTHTTAMTSPRDGQWQVLQAPGLYSLPALLQAWAGLALPVVAGSALAAFGDRLPVPPATRRVQAECNRGAALLHLALHAWAAGQAVDAAQALPLYVRDKVAQTTQERERARDQAREQARASLEAAP